MNFVIVLICFCLFITMTIFLVKAFAISNMSYDIHQNIINLLSPTEKCCRCPINLTLITEWTQCFYKNQNKGALGVVIEYVISPLLINSFTLTPQMLRKTTNVPLLFFKYLFRFKHISVHVAFQKYYCKQAFH
uniref:Uncharacterized protein n=1 Tax=Onchocerca volvulus TaxID=6282 RepID=A0A8R1TM91_ONCVO